MLYSDFKVRLHRVNPELMFKASNSSNTFAGVCLPNGKNGTAISKHWVPRDRTIVDANSRILYRSAHDALRILIAKGAISRRKAQRVFNMRLDRKMPPIRMDRGEEPREVITVRGENE